MKAKIKGIILDADGVLYLGRKPIEGAREALQFLFKKNIPFVIFTNTTIKSREGVAKKIRDILKIDLSYKNIVTASYLTALYIKKKNASVWPLVAEDGKKEFFGLKIDEENPDYVAIGDLGEEFNFDILNRAFQKIMAGAKLLAMQKDPNDLTEKGWMLNVGAWVALLEKASGKRAITIGKPSLRGYRLILQNYFSLPKENIAMVGDNLKNDILPAKKIGLKTVFVKTGISWAAKSNIDIKKADYILKSIKDLPLLLS